MPTRREEIEEEIGKLEGYAKDSRNESYKLKKDVANTSSPSNRVLQTFAHLAGKEAGDNADASMRHRENIKEATAEDAEQNAELVMARIKALRAKKEKEK